MKKRITTAIGQFLRRLGCLSTLAHEWEMEPANKVLYPPRDENGDAILRCVHCGYVLPKV